MQCHSGSAVLLPFQNGAGGQLGPVVADDHPLRAALAIRPSRSRTTRAPHDASSGEGRPATGQGRVDDQRQTFAGWSYQPPPPGSGVRRLIDRRQSRGSGAGSGSAAASSAPAFPWRICVRRGAESSPSLPVEASQRHGLPRGPRGATLFLQPLASASARSDPLTEVLHCSAIGAARISVRAQPAMHWRWRRERGAAA